MMEKKKTKKCRQVGKKTKKQNNEEPINGMDQDMTVLDDGQRDVEEGPHERV